LAVQLLTVYQGGVCQAGSFVNFLNNKFVVLFLMRMFLYRVISNGPVESVLVFQLEGV